MKYTSRWNLNRGYMKLEAWQSAQELTAIVTKILNRSTSREFRVRSQIHDSAHSFPANIAEGYCRKSINEYIQFCYIALGSAGELMSRMVSIRLSEWIENADFEEFDKKHFEAENKLLALVKSLEVKRREGTWIQELHEQPQSYSPKKSRKSKRLE